VDVITVFPLLTISTTAPRIAGRLASVANSQSLAVALNFFALPL
jgi:hypothetical protein